MIEALPISERPRERCLEAGSSCLSLRECLAIILGTGPREGGCLGLASSILQRPGKGMTLPSEEHAFFIAMETTGAAHLKEVKGLGPAGQAKILAAFELGRRYALFKNQKPKNPRKLPTLPELATRSLGKISERARCEPKEWLGFVPIYPSGKVGELCVVENGVRTHVNTDPIELFARILALRPKGFFLFHNHPSGMIQPSPQDLDLTRRVGEISRKLNIQLLGHWIVAPQNEHWIQPH